ncbi:MULTISPECIES: hypothetical protein [unclassified Microcoleus]|uniref:hypothetical protein n=1 Tax=unclassified Microcoleus TaxID=2642155 RepID=UPI002FCF6465
MTSAASRIEPKTLELSAKCWEAGIKIFKDKSRSHFWHGYFREFQTPATFRLIRR